ncbi:hypothetical protein KM043_013820 [Ampulex compressa]|nr:hypothetical protein KM043_013820 [Ampulex compressa]
MSNKKQFTEIQLTVPWGHVAAKVYGSPTDIAVLMVHGILDNAGTFNNLLELLPNGYQYICIDLPGHGLSSHFPPGLPLDFFNYVYTINLVLDALNWKTCIYIDAWMPLPYNDAAMLNRLQNIYKSESLNNSSTQLYTKEEVLYALGFKRASALNSKAAEALFERAVTKVGDVYRYNRDLRMKMFLRPLLNMDQYTKFLFNLNTPVTMITTSVRKKQYQGLISNYMESDIHPKLIEIIFVEGNHDVHNNNPERVAPHITKVLLNNIKSKI